MHKWEGVQEGVTAVTLGTPLLEALELEGPGQVALGGYCHQFCRRYSTVLLGGCLQSKWDPRQMVRPVVDSQLYSQGIFQLPMCSFHHPISAGVVCYYLNMCDTQPLTQDLPDL